MKLFNRHGLGRTLLVAAVLAVGAVCWLGCGGDDNQDNNNNGGGSSVVYGNPLVYGSQTYKTVVIGDQTWMAANLNYATPRGSLCYGDDTSNCVQYGRLYDWATARKVCPDGWKLPSRADWTTLANFVDKENGVYGAAKKLKSKSGWSGYRMDGSSANGTDNYGFSALSGGGRLVLGECCNNIAYSGVGGYEGYWWTDTEYDSERAYGVKMTGLYDNVGGTLGPKESGYSVRCLKNN